MKYILLLIIYFLLTSCSAVISLFDGVHLLYRYDDGDINAVEKPKDFVVSPSEIKNIIPITKSGWNIYVDKNSYYISSALQKISSPSGDNSYYAKKDGVAISGVDRDDIEKIKNYMLKSNRTHLHPRELRRILAD